MMYLGIVSGLFGFADKLGLKDSILSQCQRLGCVMTDDYIKCPPAGTPLLVDLFGVVEHSGIYLGGGMVAELFGDNLLREVTLKEFLEGDPEFRVRTGRRIFAACSKAGGAVLHSDFAVENARAFIRRKRTVRYDLFRNNCHLFSISCISGNFQSGITISEMAVRGGISVGVLTHAISYFLNAENEVVWKPVEEWDLKTLCGKSFEETSRKMGMRPKNVGELLDDRVRKVEETKDFKLDRAKVVETVAKASKTGVFAPCAALVGMAYDMVRDGFDGKLPRKSMCWLAAALLYLVSPLDLVPDIVPVVGFADDAYVIIQVFLMLGSLLRMPDDVRAKLMTIDSPVARWIKSLGEAPGRKSEMADEPGVNRNFEISKKLLGYYSRRLGIDLPFKINVDPKWPGWRWLDFEGCRVHGWKLQVSFLGCRIVDPLGNACFCGTKKKDARRLFDKFANWYENKLMPAIINEVIATPGVADSSCNDAGQIA